MLVNQGKKNHEVKTASVQRTYSELVSLKRVILILFATTLIEHENSPLLEEEPAP
jgi:hypothetical protein